MRITNFTEQTLFYKDSIFIAPVYMFSNNFKLMKINLYM